jgi:cytochrome c oxidase subunit II
MLMLGRPRPVVLVIALLASSVVACQGSPSPLDPRTEPTARMAELGWVLIVLGAVASVVAIGALVAALVVGAARSQRNFGESEGARAVVIGGLVLPGLLIAVILGYTIYTLREVAGTGGPGGAALIDGHAEHGPPAAAAPGLALSIAGTQWWWRVTYPDQQLITANEIHLPAGVPVQLGVTSEDVIHSFWIPQVAGKVDMLPSRINRLSLRVDQPGVYRGMCSEFCGVQHARMHLRLFVESPDGFDEWLANEQRDAVPATDPRLGEGLRVFLNAGCGECHTIRGTSAAGTSAPDLTHMARRTTLGAGTHENNRANLTGWIVDPQAMKPGNKMPATLLSPAELDLLLGYVESLR